MRGTNAEDDLKNLQNMNQTLATVRNDIIQNDTVQNSGDGTNLEPMTDLFESVHHELKTMKKSKRTSKNLLNTLITHDMQYKIMDSVKSE